MLPAEGLQRTLTGTREISHNPDHFPLSQARLQERQGMIAVVASADIPDSIKSQSTFHALRAAIVVDPFTRTIAPDQAREQVLVAKWDAMQFLAEVHPKRFAADSPTRENDKFNTTQRRIFDFYPDMETALLHPDTGVGFLVFEQLVARLNTIRPPLEALLQAANFDAVDPETRDAVLALYYEGRAQQKNAALERLNRLSVGPDWQRKWITKTSPDGSIKTIGEELVDAREMKRREITSDLHDALVMTMQLGGLSAPLTTRNVRTILEDITRGKYEVTKSSEEVGIQEEHEQIAA